jgi:predicted kinase
MNRNDIIVLVGLPGAGKSEYAKELAEEGYVICSSDEVRGRMFGNANDQDHNAEVFQILHKEIRAHLMDGDSVVYDACNIHSKRRKAFLDTLKDIRCKKSAHVITTPYRSCIDQNRGRERVVPNEVIDRMYKHWQTPSMWEGFDEIELVPMIPGEPFDIGKYDGYDQNNPHHKHDLGSHMRMVAEYVKERSSDYSLYMAALRHDSGKPYCEFKDESGISHFHCHENVGAYDVLCDWMYDDDECLEISRLINYHMYPMSWEQNGKTGRKTAEKYRKLWGNDFFNKIMLLHEADKAS